MRSAKPAKNKVVLNVSIDTFFKICFELGSFLELSIAFSRRCLKDQFISSYFKNRHHETLYNDQDINNRHFDVILLNVLH
jgi:hypothetical protein